MPLSLSFIKGIQMKRDLFNPNLPKLPNKSGPIAEFNQMVSYSKRFWPDLEYKYEVTSDGSPGEIIIDWVTGDRNHYVGETLILRNILTEMKIEQTKLSGILLERDILEEKEEFEDLTDLTKPGSSALKKDQKPGGAPKDDKSKAAPKKK